jgi:hypothetical protein
MRRLLLAVLPLLSLAARPPVEPPSPGCVQDAGGRLLKVVGQPGAWHVEETAFEEDCPASGLAAGWSAAWNESGQLRLLLDTTGESWLLPNADAPLALYVVVDPDRADPVGSVYTFAPVAAGETLDVTFRAKNTTTSALTVNRLALSGSSFRIVNSFPLPWTLAPGAVANFVVRFEPTVAGDFQATVQVNTQTWTMAGSAAGLPGLEVYDNGVWQTVPATAAIDFGTVPQGSTVERWFRITLPSGVASPAPPVVEGAGFTLTVAGGVFRIEFRPPGPGTFTARLTVGPRVYTLAGAGETPQVPQPLLSLTASGLPSGKQQTVTITLASPAPADVTGILRLEFVPETIRLPDDSSIAFLPSLTRSVVFTVAGGKSAAEFGTAKEVTLQTGATAGWLTLRATLENQSDERRIHIAPAPVLVTTATALRSSSLAEVVLGGIDNTHDAGALVFRFYRADGQMVAPGAIQADASPLFQAYYSDNPKLAGSFQLRAQFPVSGDAAQISGVEVSIANSAGETAISRISINPLN